MSNASEKPESQENTTDKSEILENPVNDNLTDTENAAPEYVLRDLDALALNKMIDDLEVKLDKVMRVYADAENRAKRAEKERLDALKYGASKMGRDLLDVADNVSRAINSLNDAQKEAFKEVYEGFVLTEKSLIQTFERHDIVRISTEGKFDPNIHEAVTQVPMPDKTSGDIIDTLRTGYKMGDRLLRPAQVVVCA